ncbi:MAG TPA: hypothetical protein VM914_09635 [Pyrinomonadaceae bacterium]|jgi:hypothetical protein|nr:hypothetical protein [Pyrinomonadaceae bacterium]
MKALRLAILLLAASPALLCAGGRAAHARDDSTRDDAGEWSRESGGLRARLKIVDKGELHGARWLVPYLELRNVRDLAAPLQVNLDRGHLKIELTGAEGTPVGDRRPKVRSGPTPQPGTVSLPWDSFMRVSLECRNWGIPRDAPAMVSTDSGAWVVRDDENGKLFLRATLTGEKANPEWKTWGGTLQTPPVKVVWK